MNITNNGSPLTHVKGLDVWKTYDRYYLELYIPKTPFMTYIVSYKYKFIVDIDEKVRRTGQPAGTATPTLFNF